jgi:RimJ/RimL family protein N-acetyltransferase
MSAHDIRTDRLLLRPVALDDLDAMYDVHADPATSRHSPTGPIVRSRDEARVKLAGWVTHWNEAGFGYWAVRLLDGADGTVLGFGGAMRGALTLPGRPPLDVANLYYRLRPSSWGHGYATEMARAARRLVAERAPDRPLIAAVRPANVGSARVAEHVGLVPYATVERSGQPMVIYAEPGRLPPFDGGS